MAPIPCLRSSVLSLEAAGASGGEDGSTGERVLGWPLAWPVLTRTAICGCSSNVVSFHFFLG